MGPFTLSQGIIAHFGIHQHNYLGRGGQKTVFKVIIDNRKFALKIIHHADERILREIQINKEFESLPGLPAVVKIEEIEGDVVILEEYIEGTDLSDKLDEYVGQEVKVCELIYQIAEILEPIWKKRYVHRDLKPQNIRIKPDDSPIILDFGIARALDDESITTTGNQPLSPKYASPEQYLGKKELISYRTDFFCLGIIVYQLFTGHLPFGQNIKEIQKSFENKKNNFETTSVRITNFCERVLAFNPSERPGKIEQFKQLLKP